MECSYWKPSLSDKHVGAAHSLPDTHHKASYVCRSRHSSQCLVRSSSLAESMSCYLIRTSSHDLIRRSLLVQLAHRKSCIPYVVLFKHYLILLILDKAFRYWQVGR